MYTTQGTVHIGKKKKNEQNEKCLNFLKQYWVLLLAINYNL